MKHLPLDFDTFVSAVAPDVMERYYDSLTVGNIPAGWARLNGSALEQFLALPENAELDAVIRQDLRRFNDLAIKGPAILFDSYERHDVDYDRAKSPEELALLAFLDQRNVWDFAWSRFLLFALDSKVSVFAFPTCATSFADEQVAAFKSAVSNSFLHQAKGSECEVHAFGLNEEQIIYVKRGYYIRTVTRWQAQETGILSYRPVLEDVLAYDPLSGELTVKAAQDRERADYVRLFAHYFAGDMMLGEQALKSRTFDLAPVANGTFNYQGEGLIVDVHLVGIKQKLPFKQRATLQLNSPNIFDTLKQLPGISLDMGELIAARFRFRIAEGKTTIPTTFEVAPPSRTDLPETAYASLINAYLKKQGVRLR